MTYDEYARALLEMKMMPDLGKMMGPIGFYSKQSRIAYYASGSFCKFLIEKYGIEKFKNVYYGKSFESIYGKKFDEISSRWKGEVFKIKLSEKLLKYAEIIFKPKGIFGKKCAREVECLSVKAKQYREDFSQSVNYAKQALRLSGNNIYQRRLLMKTYNWNRNYKKAYDEAQIIAKTKNIPDNLILSYLEMGFTYNLMIEDFKTALDFVIDIIELGYNATVNLEYSIFKRMLENSSLQKTLKNYISSKDLIDRRKIIVDMQRQGYLKDIGDNLLLYTAYLYFKTDEYGTALNYLKKIRAPFGNTMVDKYYHKLKLRCYFETRNYEAAKKNVENYQKRFNSAADRLYVKDWLERIEFSRRSIPSRMKDQSDIF